MAIVISVFSFGASGIEGMSIWGVASATLFANILIAVVGSLTGDIGVEHGLSFATYLRAPFGITGVHLPAIARGIVAACWFGINTYIGSTAINYFTLALFGIDNWFLWFLIFAAVQIVNTMLGIKAIDKFSSFAAPCIILITCWMFYKVHAIAVLNNITILGYAPPSPSSSCWLITMCANTGMWAALAADIPNMTRSLKAPVGERNWFKRNINNWVPQFATLPIIETFIAVIGAISYLTTGNWNPVEVIQAQAHGATLIILLVMVILAQWSTNTAANLVPPAMCFTNAGARWNLPYKVAVLIAGLIGVCVMPWKILDQLYTYLGISVGNEWIIPGYEAVAGINPTVTSLVQDVNVSAYTGGKEYEARTGHPLIITFGRQYGSRGKELAGILAKKLDLPIYDEDMIKLASRALNVDESTLRKENEVPRNELLHALTAGGMFAAKEYEAATSDKMFDTQSQIILDLAKKSSCIIVGRCANYVLERAHIPTTDIFVVANLDDRIKHIAQRDHTTYDKAKLYVARTEKRREAYFNYYTSYEWGNPEFYDVCVNTSSTDMDELADHLVGYIDMKTGA